MTSRIEISKSDDEGSLMMRTFRFSLKGKIMNLGSVAGEKFPRAAGKKNLNPNFP